MRKSIFAVVSVLLVLGFIMSACGAKPGAGLKVGQVTDTGGIDDRSFNATAWKGVQDAVRDLGVEGKYLESQQQTDYERNIKEFMDDNYSLIVTVGFLLGPATAKAAIDNPDQKFAIVDYAYPDCWPGAVVGKDCGSDKVLDNVLGLTFGTDEAAFLAGYLAAGMSKTGKVGTFALFFVLAFGMLGFVAKGIIQKMWGI